MRVIYIRHCIPRQKSVTANYITDKVFHVRRFFRLTRYGLNVGLWPIRERAINGDRTDFNSVSFAILNTRNISKSIPALNRQPSPFCLQCFQFINQLVMVNRDWCFGNGKINKDSCFNYTIHNFQRVCSRLHANNCWHGRFDFCQVHGARDVWIILRNTAIA